MKWFRVYDDLVDDPKVQTLPLEQFRALINLWCLASQNDGALPTIDVMAFKLRVKPAKMRNIVEKLRSAGLVDEADGSLTPHNWNVRQFRSDLSSERVRRYRERQQAPPETFHETFPKRPQSQSQSQIDDDGEDARAQPTKSMLSAEALRVIDEIAQVAGITKETWPPGWCGAVYVVQKFIDEGCPGEIVKLGAIGALKRKRDGPPNSFSYFEKPIAAAFAQHLRPLPHVVVAPAETVEIRNGQRNRPASITAIAAERWQELQADIEAEAAGNRRGSGDPDVELDSSTE